MFPLTQQFIQRLLSDETFPGVSYGFTYGKSKISSYLGDRQLTPEKRPVTPETRFDLASLTKVICTTTVLLKLVEANLLHLDDPVQLHLPSFTDSKVTLRHLLTHTSDIDSYIAKRDSLSQAELIQALLKLKSGENIGRQVVYTDTGTLLLGFLLETYYKKDLHTIFKQEVLIPLSMSESSFPPVQGNVAATESHPYRGTIIGEVHDPKAFVLKEHCGSAGLFATLNDCFKFSDMILQEGLLPSGEIFLKPKTIQSLFEDHTPKRNLGRSLGWDLIKAPANHQNLLFHTGYTGTFIILDRENHSAFIFLSNRLHPKDNLKDYLKKRDELITLYLQEKDSLDANLL